MSSLGTRNPPGKPMCVPGLHWIGLVVVARRSTGKPWYLLTSEPVETAEQAWAIVFAYVRRGPIELAFKHCKSELSFHASSRVGVGNASQVVGVGHPGLCLLAAPAPLVVPLRLSPYRNPFAPRPCPLGPSTKSAEQTFFLTCSYFQGCCESSQILRDG